MSWTFPFLGETKEIDEATRSNTTGSFIRLSDGYTHYQIGGSEDGEPVVLVHGFSVPYFIWDPTFEFLASSGFRVLRYDLFGRGFSDRPKTTYDIDLFCRQLRELIDTLGLVITNMIGLSMGGPITATFVVRYPELVKKLVLIDPAGAKPVTFLRVFKAATISEIGELAIGLFGRKGLSRGVKSDFYKPANIQDFVHKYMLQMQYKGFMRALLSTVRDGMLGDFSHTYLHVGEQGTPTMLFWGRDDRTVPLTQSKVILQAIPLAEFHIFEQCGHIPHYEKPEEANPLLLEFLR